MYQGITPVHLRNSVYTRSESVGTTPSAQASIAILTRYFRRGVSHLPPTTYKKILEGINFKDKTILDVGCGRGDVLRYCLQNSADKVIGIDFSSAAILISKIVLSSFKKEFWELYALSPRRLLRQLVLVELALWGQQAQ